MTPNTEEDKTILITGASSGIGKATAEALARHGHQLILVCRNQQRGQQALTEIQQKNPQARLHLFLADLSSLQEVRRLAEELQPAFPVIDVLINNAGLIPGYFETTPDGFEVAWATNHLAPFLLTNLLMDQLLASEQGRVINVSSEAHRLGQIDFEHAGKPQKYSAITAYADSKLANIHFTYELARRTEFTNLTVNCLHPGIIASGFGRNSNFFIRHFFRLSRFFMKSPAKGAQTSVYLATSPYVKLVSGKYFKNSQQVKSAADSYNFHIARRLWDISAEQTGFNA
ncbi:SDR family oxidoreductase [Rufibacter glacialis]|uniref:SDR family oxidoreductase n=1 Tax=Rufibacter glacialis TaxID=1259555 RepID=A0A5M8QJ87_9BACT|nr:SDR family oxidoreductase [Rufibacter glacialis]KAA6434412.1 SDR family oxidoreductase [Rufibacter glacialis]GGK69322.1 short-chain dehydrogenase [Rufibacter glacialis]